MRSCAYHGDVSAPPAPDRRALAIACLAASGIVLPWSGPLGWPLAAIVCAGWLAWQGLGAPSERAKTQHPRCESLALALLLALLLRSLARVLVSVPMLVSGLVLALLVLGLVARRSSAGATGLVLVALVAGTALGELLEREGPTPQGRVDSSPLLGVHPRQAVAITIDGYGPHDVIADDFVEPSGVQGHDPQRWAARLESELHAIAAQHYAEGPARAREAFAAASVVVVTPAIVPEDAAKLAIVTGIAVRSGTRGEGSSVAFGCAGAVGDPRRDAGPRSSECPHKYARDGSTGLGLSPRWPGYTELRGRDRLRLATLLGWPSGAPEHDERRLALELALLALALLAALAWISRGASRPTLDGLALLAALLVLGLALLDAGAPRRASDPSAMLVLAPLLFAGPRERSRASLGRVLALALIVLVGGSALAGHAGVVALGEALLDPLVLELGASWSLARGTAGLLLALALLPGAIACARELADAGRQRDLPHPSTPWLLVAALLLVLGPRKPGDDPALLACAVALLLATSLTAARPGARVVAVGLALAAALPLLGPGSRDFVGLAMVAGLALLTLVVAWSSAHRPVER
jgi:hypothetical protein